MTVTLDKTPDFGGWATKAGLECADGLTIGHDAFKEMFANSDLVKVPLVYQHIHDEIENVLGHALLENRGEGVYAHCYFNNTEKGQIAKEAVQHEDLTMMSIYANRLRKERQTVVHGVIREVSLVQAGANPGALIDFISMMHTDEYGETQTKVLETEAFITTGLSVKHSADEIEADKKAAEVVEEVDDPDETWESMSPKQQALVEKMLKVVQEAKDDGKQQTDEEKEAAEKEAAEKEAAEKEAADGNEAGEGQEAADAAAKEAEANQEEAPPANAEDAPNTETAAAPADAASSDAGDAAHSDLNNSDLKGSEMTDTTTITHNVFDQEALKHSGLTGMAKDGQYVLSHSDKENLFSDALKSRTNSLKDVVESFKISHGIENIDILFPDAKAVSDVPEWVKRRTEWVDRVINGAKHTPFSRIKSLSADLTLEQARAKGYIKGALKKEEFFAVAKRITTPQTIYKKQALDRDDILDITDFDVVVWLKGEMRIMLDEELGRAVLIGDGRSNADDDKILEDKIRPIATDHELFQTTVMVQLGANTDAEKIVDAFLLNRRFYKGSGNPDLFTTEEYISRILNVKDNTGRRIYDSISHLASVLRVNSIIPVEVMEEIPDLVGIMVNMVDYTIGTDRGGNVSLFDDFDIDYNKYKYLIETRCSGALTKPKSALVVRRAAADAELVVAEAPAWDPDAHTVTVATTTGITYKNQANGAVLTTAAPVALAPDQEMTVIAVPSGVGYYIESNEADEFTFTYEDGLIDGPH